VRHDFYAVRHDFYAVRRDFYALQSDDFTLQRYCYASQCHHPKHPNQAPRK